MKRPILPDYAEFYPVCTLCVDVGVDAPLDFEDGGVVCDSSCVAVLSGCVAGAVDSECVWGSHEYTY